MKIFVWKCQIQFGCGGEIFVKIFVRKCLFENIEYNSDVEEKIFVRILVWKFVWKY